jgi:hypothetical protein
MFQPTGGASGEVVRIPFNNPGQVEHIGGGSLPLPRGIAQCPEGVMYVSVNSASPGFATSWIPGLLIPQLVGRQ